LKPTFSATKVVQPEPGVLENPYFYEHRIIRHLITMQLTKSSFNN